MILQMIVPSDCFDFLAGQDLTFSFRNDSDSDFEVRMVELVKASDLVEVSVPLYSGHYRDFFGDCDAPLSQRWEFKAVPLVLREFDEEYAPHCLLLWFPELNLYGSCLLYTSPSPRDQRGSRMPSSA